MKNAAASAVGTVCTPSAATVVAAALRDGAIELPVLPRVAQEVMVVARDSSRGAAEVARLVERDPALCATVLRAANSAIYGGSVEIVSARQAVLRLGLVEVATLATTAAMRSALVDHGPFAAALTCWWRRALTTGLYAKEIARLRRQAVDSAFLCGLLRDVGEPVVLRVLARAHVEVGDGVDAVIAEFRRAAGTLLCDAWQLGGAVRAVVTEDVEPPWGDHVATARLADAFARLATPSPTDAAALNLYPEDLEVIAAKTPTIVASVESMS
ncbi:MAG: HDOD domain-containing protein [Deltaproteobacteria bacterium]|nr:HDOD domain-containing protein [Deltaproteobacteria bacterium]MBK8713344.1 HDOD domain-containing protein [Deltaproteobacteria bacterium]MBP7289312.1 HDOD domain-containing protein [Nannocystaceae bacterium]